MQFINRAAIFMYLQMSLLSISSYFRFCSGLKVKNKTLESLSNDPQQCVFKALFSTLPLFMFVDFQTRFYPTPLPKSPTQICDINS